MDIEEDFDSMYCFSPMPEDQMMIDAAGMTLGGSSPFE
jgi:hypothetical protein